MWVASLGYLRLNILFIYSFLYFLYKSYWLFDTYAVQRYEWYWKYANLFPWNIRKYANLYWKILWKYANLNVWEFYHNNNHCSSSPKWTQKMIINIKSATYRVSWDFACKTTKILLLYIFLGHNRNVVNTKSPYPIKRLEVIRRFNQKSMAFNQSLSWTGWHKHSCLNKCSIHAYVTS